VINAYHGEPQFQIAIDGARSALEANGLGLGDVRVLAYCPRDAKGNRPYEPVVVEECPVGAWPTLVGPRPMPVSADVVPTPEVASSSAKEIAKLAGWLPFHDDMPLKTGRTVTIEIARPMAPTGIDVLILGIDYQAASERDDPEYKSSKDSFVEAADLVLAWLQARGADPRQIIVSWGHRKFERDAAQLWLTDSTP
jgi:hypothetical protein